MLSGCGGIYSSVTHVKDTETDKRISYSNIITNKACAYVTSVGICQLPQIIFGTPEQIIIPNKSSYYKGTVITDSSELHISMWGSSGFG